MAVTAKPAGVTFTRHTVTKGSVDTTFQHTLEYDYDNAGTLERHVVSDFHDLTGDVDEEEFVNGLIDTIYSDLAITPPGP